MFDYISISIYRVINWFAYPFLLLRGRNLGVEHVANEFLSLIRKVCAHDSFHHSFNDMYVIYSLGNGIFFKSDKCHNGVLSISNNYNKQGTMEINRLELKNIVNFSRFCYDVEKNASLSERWSLNYHDKKITSIVCKLTIVPHYINHKNNRHEAIKMALVFDCEFNIVSLIKQHFMKINCPQADITYHKEPVSTIMVQDNISLEEEFLMIKLAIAADDSPLIEMFPEYYMHTVYDYSSVEFKQRLELYYMVNF